MVSYELLAENLGSQGKEFKPEVKNSNHLSKPDPAYSSVWPDTVICGHPPADESPGCWLKCSNLKPQPKPTIPASLGDGAILKTNFPNGSYAH